ncbi:hypothetical protein CBM2626_U50011 [Cupriavidus taiwanensis]|uniref:Transposase n=1 Tax=Cupriavidus taiwanensis TaxID=164546 RepID=A0A375FN26_9BURK|nr:IS66 family insertion sequence element accessory protein TnpB [Cupriavidus taiwanensis]SOZ73599.1 hypothetical protein CBM2614_U50003 [Cupriavidus taiwanensis]SOZ73919.1 hypothetical protein CBM2615_U40011 [Cupriavidus taiwanensis]SOZ75396.1 hypothetical protein CBM2613_U40012 [Cupriavidus taiwanensis]SPA03907.1 hypothetical protein CBM2626_U50011 [Cupriavidus taiwanensis]SPA12880.1 hypothetical protein CBM2625_U50013 [Cupriavidus taiwanensis]
MIRIDSLWLAVEPIDMRARSERLLARVVQAFGAAQSHHTYLFSNAGHTRMKLFVHDGFGVWCAVGRLNQGRFTWPAYRPRPSDRRSLLASNQVGGYHRPFVSCPAGFDLSGCEHGPGKQIFGGHRAAPAAGRAAGVPRSPKSRASPTLDIPLPI